MIELKGVILDGQVVLPAPADLPDGTKVAVFPLEVLPAVEFMTEEQQSDDPLLFQQWTDDLRAIPPLSMTPAQETEMLAWRQKIKDFNREAVRLQMEEGMP